MIDFPSFYKPLLSLQQSEVAIKAIKDFFERSLADSLHLLRVSAPLVVLSDSGLNDQLNGIERPIRFDIKDYDFDVEVVQSLAKWKRLALKRYQFQKNEGLYTDMNALRRDETLDAIHSIFVDQWDWEKIIAKEDRHQDYLKMTVTKIYQSLLDTEQMVSEKFSIPPSLPQQITFISSQQLEDMYPELTHKEQEYEICKKHGAVFIVEIGAPLRSGIPFDGRSPDYDDWSLNGDLLVYYPLLDIALELSSMGIRVDAQTCIDQCHQANVSERLNMPYHQMLIQKQLPYTIGGGIGQSRMCLFLLKKAHIGEVQASIWPQRVHSICEQHGIILL